MVGLAIMVRLHYTTTTPHRNLRSGWEAAHRAQQTSFLLRSCNLFQKGLAIVRLICLHGNLFELSFPLLHKNVCLPVQERPTYKLPMAKNDKEFWMFEFSFGFRDGHIDKIMWLSHNHFAPFEINLCWQNSLPTNIW